MKDFCSRLPLQENVDQTGSATRQSEAGWENHPLTDLDFNMFLF